MSDVYDVVVVGCGAAGLAALERLSAAAPDLRILGLEARDRIGGRAHTVVREGLPLDLGCGWLHSADRNPFVELARGFGVQVDDSEAAWTKQSAGLEFPPEEQKAFFAAFDAFEARVAAAGREPDRPAGELLEPGGRWNPLIDAISSWYNGAEYDRISVHDYLAYEDDEVNWRLPSGYGALVARVAEGLPVRLGAPVTRIDRSGPILRLDTPEGEVRAQAIVLAVPTPILAEERLRFDPPLPAKTEAAADLPLGLANKAVLGLAEPEALPAEGHWFGRTDRTDTGSHYLRPFGRPYVETFFGGRCADALELEGPGAATDFAIEEMANLVGTRFRKRATGLAETRWRAEPWSGGGYSYARQGRHAARAELVEPVEDRIFFAGEAAHSTLYSTCHGARLTGLRAADEILERLGRRRPEEA